MSKVGFLTADSDGSSDMTQHSAGQNAPMPTAREVSRAARSDMDNGVVAAAVSLVLSGGRFAPLSCSRLIMNRKDQLKD